MSQVYTPTNNVLTAQVHGHVDWISQDGKEAGVTLVRDTAKGRTETRCLLKGPEVERQLESGALEKRMKVTAFGKLAARSWQQEGSEDWVSELTCDAYYVQAESFVRRFAGTCSAMLKGKIMFWKAETLQLWTYFNPNPNTGETASFMCSLNMKWFFEHRPEARERLMKYLFVGREYTTTGTATVSHFVGKSGLTTYVDLLPSDFQLAG